MAEPSDKSPPAPSTCPQCGARDMYKEKAFPKKIGIAIVIVAVILSFWTYNLSLLAAAAIDGVIYLFVPFRLICYQCRQVYKDVPIPEQIKGYDHHTAELYNYGK